ncbi:MAG TPA: ABC transporter substrate-binding protein [Conexibacter sp.]|nr:ABC transporter substrate-binding protein [Conexibacter sp.]
MRWKKMVPGAIAICALAVAGCGGSSSDDGGGTTTSDSGTTAQVARGGRLTVADTIGIPQLNPVIRTFGWEEVLFPLLWNGLSKADESGEIVPDLATGWRASADQRTWTFDLRTDVRYSNGRPLTSANVVSAFEYYLDPRTTTQEAGKIASIASIRADGPARVVVQLRSPNALFPAAIVWVKIIDVDNLDQIDKRPVVTGPYMVSDFVPDDHVTLVPNPEHAGDPAPLDELRIVKATDSTSALSALRAGDLDVLWATNPADVSSVESDPDLKTVSPEVPSKYVDWEFDTTSPPFDNVKARQAVAYAVDREAVLESAYYGLGDLAPTNNPLSTNNPFYGGELTDYSYDLEKARSLFAEAGINAGDTITWWGTAGANAEWTTAAEILQASLKEIGIELKIENREVATWADKFYPAGKRFPNFIVPNLASFPPSPADAFGFYREGRCECNWKSPEFERAYEAAMAEPDEAAALEKWGTVQEIVNREVPLIIPLQAKLVASLRSNVDGVWMEGGGQLHLEQAGLAD